MKVKNLWADVLLVAGIICFILFMCNGPCVKPDGQADLNPYDSAMEAHREYTREKQMEFDSLLFVKESQDSMIVKMNETLSNYKVITKLQKQETDKYVQLYHHAKSLLDTQVMVIACDSIVEEYNILAYNYDREIKLADSIIVKQFAAIYNRDSIIGMQRDWIGVQQGFISKQDSANRVLTMAYWEQQDRIKARRKLTFWAAAAAFVLGVVIAK